MKKNFLELIRDKDFKTLSKRDAHPRERVRYLAFAHLKDGKKIADVAAMLMITRMSIYNWIKLFLNEGMQGLKEKDGRGRKSRLPLSQREAFKQAVLELQASRSGGRIQGKDVLQLMEEKFGIRCSLRSVYHHLHRAQLVWISARSKHPKGDLEKQEAFKKTLKLKS